MINQTIYVASLNSCHTSELTYEINPTIYMISEDTHHIFLLELLDKSKDL
jgi:hypothetical protein